MATGTFTSSVGYDVLGFNIMSIQDWEQEYGDFPSSFWGAIIDADLATVERYRFASKVSATIDGTVFPLYGTTGSSSNNLSYIECTRAIAQKNNNTGKIQLLADTTNTSFRNGRTYKWVLVW